MRFGAAPPTKRSLDHVSQIKRCLKRCILAAHRNRPRHTSRVCFLAEPENDIRQIMLVHAVYNIGCARARLPHAHIQRPVTHERKPARGLVNLERRHTQIQHHAVKTGKASLLRQFIERAKAPQQRGQAWLASSIVLRARNCCLVPVYPKQTAISCA